MDKVTGVRFAELSPKLVGKYGAEIVLNLDSLKEQKTDPFVASLIIELFVKVKKVVLFSDFCSNLNDDIANFYE